MNTHTTGHHLYVKPIGTSIQNCKAAPLLLLLVVLGSSHLSAQEGRGDDRYFTHFSFDGFRNPIFCGEIDSASASPHSYGVRYDSLGLPQQVIRYYFGNLDSRSEWAIMRFTRDSTPSGGLIVTRTWHLPNGDPARVGLGFGEQALYDSTGSLLLLQSIDIDGQRLERVNGVTRQIFRPHPDGGYLQEWRYANNRQYHGGEVDPWNTQVPPLSEEGWFRHLTLDSAGNVATEYPMALNMKPILFPEGVEMKRYVRNGCGLPVSLEFRRRSGEPMEDYHGVSRITFTYNDRGQLLTWSAFNLEGNLTPYVEGAARVEREYRQFDGRLVAERRFDVEGELIEEVRG